ncbi:MAG TPA: hypothetical protein VIH52_04835 [Candidatus Nanoarchaeia archaeon]|nr:hypothetical protein [uncultured archaeon]
MAKAPESYFVKTTNVVIDEHSGSVAAEGIGPAAFGRRFFLLSGLTEEALQHFTAPEPVFWRQSDARGWEISFLEQHNEIKVELPERFTYEIL